MIRTFYRHSWPINCVLVYGERDRKRLGLEKVLIHPQVHRGVSYRWLPALTHPCYRQPLMRRLRMNLEMELIREENKGSSTIATILRKLRGSQAGINEAQEARRLHRRRRVRPRRARPSRKAARVPTR